MDGHFGGLIHSFLNQNKKKGQFFGGLSKPIKNAQF
jgi:hypothetical protein